MKKLLTTHYSLLITPCFCRPNYRKDNNLSYLIEVDGGINEETSKLVKERNVDILVAGSFIIKSSDYKTQIDKLK